MDNLYVKTLEPVWNSTKDVWVNEDKLQELIRQMKEKKEGGELKIPAWDIPNVQPPIDCSFSMWLNFICLINTVNFAFTNFKKPWGKFTIEYPKGSPWPGAAAMQASFTRAHNEGIAIFDAWHLVEISLREVKDIFRSVDHNHRIPMIQERWEILREIGKVLIEKYDGSWLNLFEEGDWRAFNNGKGIVEQLVANFSSFRDRRFYRGHPLEFNKRAQLLVMMYHGRAVNSGGRFPLIEDIEDVGPIADYDVPKALHFLGVLEYNRRLKADIENHKVFQPNDSEEVENRLAMSYVMWKICKEVGVTMAQADFYIWNMGRKSGDPHILVPTTDY